MSGDRQTLLAGVAAYYDERIERHGQTPQGVDWNGSESQVLRFEQLAHLFPPDDEFSVIDWGCGYGAFVDFLKGRHRVHSYLGIDLSAPMVAAARSRHRGLPWARFERGGQSADVADYAVASGIFNVRQGQSVEEWTAYVDETLDLLDAASNRGFAFNCLTSFSDEDRMRADLFYADPSRFFERCMKRYSRHVALLHDYGLYEFTLLVRKEVA